MAKPASPLSVTDWDNREFFYLEASSSARPPLVTNEADCIFWDIYGSS